MLSSGSSLYLAKITYRLFGLGKIKLLKALLMLWPCLPGVDTGQTLLFRKTECLPFVEWNDELMNLISYMFLHDFNNMACNNNRERLISDWLGVRVL